VLWNTNNSSLHLFSMNHIYVKLYALEQPAMETCDANDLYCYCNYTVPRNKTS